MSTTEKNIPESFRGSYFIFHLFNEKGQPRMSLASEYVYPPVSKDELKKLVDFINSYLEHNS